MLSVIFFAMSAHKNQSRFECRLKRKQCLEIWIDSYTLTQRKRRFLNWHQNLLSCVHVSNSLDRVAVASRNFIKKNVSRDQRRLRQNLNTRRRLVKGQIIGA